MSQGKGSTSVKTVHEAALTAATRRFIHTGQFDAAAAAVGVLASRAGDSSSAFVLVHTRARTHTPARVGGPAAAPMVRAAYLRLCGAVPGGQPTGETRVHCFVKCAPPGLSWPGGRSRQS